MPKNIVLCLDGTGNEYGDQKTRRLIVVVRLGLASCFRSQ